MEYRATTRWHHEITRNDFGPFFRFIVRVFLAPISLVLDAFLTLPRFIRERGPFVEDGIVVCEAISIFHSLSTFVIF